jgi:serine protease
VIAVFAAGGASASGHGAAAQPSGPVSLGGGQGGLPQATQDVVPGELIVQFDPDVSLATQDAALAAEGAVLQRHLLLPGFARVKVPEGQEEEFLRRLRADPSVRMVERNGIDHATFVPNDPDYPLQWDMPQVQAEQAWDVANGSGVVVAVVDTGVAYENYEPYKQAPDLDGTSFTAGYDLVNDDDHPNDDNGHGTHVTGTIAQTTNNSLGVAGLAFGASIMPVKTLDATGSGSHADMADGFVWATDHGADVINYSAGGGDSATKKAGVDYALSHGVVVVAAAGNNGTPGLDCPACYPGVVAVGATDYNMNRSYYSSYGCGLQGHCLDVVAPGGDTTADLNGDTHPDGVLQQTYEFACVGGTPDFTSFDYCFWEGTSMATPHVSAAAALLLDVNPGLTNQQVGDCLRHTALDRGPAGYDTTYGYGLIQVRAVLDACVDSDGDGCTDGSEEPARPNDLLQPLLPAETGAYDPQAWYDFYDVPVPPNPDPVPNGVRNQAVNVQDLVGVLQYVGTCNDCPPNGRGVDYDSLKDGDWFDGSTQVMYPDGLVDGWDEVGRRYDRSPSAAPNPPWGAGGPDGVVNVQDVVILLSQVGLDCRSP